MSELQQALYDNDWITSSFDCGKWQEAAMKYVEDAVKIESADAETIQKLFTTHVRKDRFAKAIWQR